MREDLYVLDMNRGVECLRKATRGNHKDMTSARHLRDVRRVLSTLFFTDENRDADGPRPRPGGRRALIAFVWGRPGNLMCGGAIAPAENQCWRRLESPP
jgi:hypothetical protein